MDPVDLQRNQTARKTKKINPLFVLFVSAILNLVLTAYLVMQYNKVAAAQERVNILQEDTLQLELIILKMQGFKVVPPKPPEKPNII